MCDGSRLSGALLFATLCRERGFGAHAWHSFPDKVRKLCRRQGASRRETAMGGYDSRALIWLSLALAVLISCMPSVVQANSGFDSAFVQRYSSATHDNAGCNTCHAGSFNRSSLNPYGLAVQQAGGNLAAVEGADSDGEGNSNLAEIQAGAQPGWCAVAGCATPPSGVGSPLDPPSAPPPNQPPVADAGGPYAATVDVPVRLSGTGSTDPDGSIVSYAWNFGNGTSGSGVSPSATYSAAGTFTVTLTVTDDAGDTDSATASVSVDAGAQPPIADPGGPYTGDAGSAVRFDGSGSRDPDGQVVAYSWDFGDGSSGTGPTPMHTYAASGTYNVSLTVTDSQNLTSVAETTASIADAGGQSPPVANAGGPYAGTVGVALTFDGSRSSDPDNDISIFAWSFGDGNTGSGVGPAHTYAAAGTYEVSLTVTDSMGNSATATTTAQVDDPAVNQPPVADPGGPYFGTPGAAVQFDGTGSVDVDGAILSYSWDFGDGAARAAGIDAGPTPSHAYSMAGDYLVRLQVTDELGATSDVASTTVTIQPASDGLALYNGQCAGCHGDDPWGGPAVDATLGGMRRVAGASACVIEASISGNSVFPGGVPEMSGLALTTEQIDAIAVYLHSRPASGEQLYVSDCAGCHGNDGRRGRVDEDVRGASAAGILEAIHEEEDMAYLACVPSSDIALMASFLSARDPESGERGKRAKCKRKDDCDADGRRDEDDDDDDNDGMPDAYEEEKGFNPFDSADASQDPDRDGKTNLAEFRAGTDPLDATSVPGDSTRGGAGGFGSAALLGLACLGLAYRRRTVPAAAGRTDRVR
jgi:PKD repeat protein/cytochrome c553